MARKAQQPPLSPFQVVDGAARPSPAARTLLPPYSGQLHVTPGRNLELVRREGHALHLGEDLVGAGLVYSTSAHSALLTTHHLPSVKLSRVSSFSFSSRPHVHRYPTVRRATTTSLRFIEAPPLSCQEGYG
jgi:hypothetical protein